MTGGTGPTSTGRASPGPSPRWTAPLPASSRSTFGASAPARPSGPTACPGFASDAGRLRTAWGLCHGRGHGRRSRRPDALPVRGGRTPARPCPALPASRHGSPARCGRHRQRHSRQRRAGRRGACRRHLGRLRVARRGASATDPPVSPRDRGGDGRPCRPAGQPVPPTFSGGFDGRDGVTPSLRADGHALGAAGCRAGAHRAQIDAHAAAAMFDHSCFSRLAVLPSRGSRDGAPPARHA